jgi:hypothetical protein
LKKEGNANYRKHRAKFEAVLMQMGSNNENFVK